MRRHRWHPRLGPVLLLVAVGAVACTPYAVSHFATAPTGPQVASPAPKAASASRTPGGTGATAKGALPSLNGLPTAQFNAAQPAPAWSGPLPYPVLIADEKNDRMLEVSPDKQILWQYPASGQANSPLGVSGDDTFFSPDGQAIVTNDEDGSTILRIGYYTHSVLWHFGVAGQSGNDNQHLYYPDDAYLLPNGNTIVADIRNCRELTIGPSGQVLANWGQPQSGYCRTDLAKGLYGYPNGDTPQPNGDILMSFISGDVIALLSPTGSVLWSTIAPNLYGGYVSDAQLLADGNVLVAGYGKPGTVVVFNPHNGQVAWRYYVTSGPGELDHPSLAEMLPNGNVLLNDDRNHRVIVIDPHSNAIVWQYGHTGVSGTGYGYLNQPDGVDLDLYRDWQAWLRVHPAPAAPPAGSTTGAQTAGGA